MHTRLVGFCCFYHHFIVINIILVDVFHDVAQKKQNSSAIKRQTKNYIVWYM